MAVTWTNGSPRQPAVTELDSTLSPLTRTNINNRTPHRLEPIKMLTANTAGSLHQSTQVPPINPQAATGTHLILPPQNNQAASSMLSNI